MTSAACAAEPLQPAAWKPNTTYIFGQRVTNDNGKVYQMVSRELPTGGKSGTTAPSGNGSSISDGNLIWTESSAGRIYYVCNCGTGADPSCAANNNLAASDSNPGTDPEKPWLTFEKARDAFSTIDAGDTIAFCRGGAFVQETQGFWNSTHCTASHPCTIRDYTPSWNRSGTALPVVVGPRVVAPGPGNDGGRALAIGNVTGLRLLNLDVRENPEVKPPAPTWGVGLGSTTADVTLCNVSIDRVATGIQDDLGEHTPTTRHTMILGSRLTNTRGMGILMAATDSVIADNYFDHNGSTATFDHAIYLSNGGAPSAIRVAGNEIYRNTLNDQLCQSVNIIAHGEYNQLIIEDNLIDNSGIAGGSCWGIAADPGGYGKPEFFKNVAIRRNRIYGVGSAGIAAGSCVDCTIEDNLVVVDGDGSEGVEAIKIPDVLANIGHGDSITTGFTVRNNTVYFTAGNTTGGAGMRSLNEGTRHVIANNVFAYYGTNSRAFVCLNLDGPGYQAVSNNACYVGPEGRIGYSEAIGTILDPPQFTDTTSGKIADYDFTPAEGSPLVGAANSTYSSPFDLTGKRRTDGKPDIGAYERQ